jgi:hypothetical protein
MADPRLDTWAKVPPDQSGLALIIESPVSLLTISSVSNILEAAKWNPKTTLVRQVRLEPGEYQLRLQGPIPTLSVLLKGGSLTYVHLGFYRGKDGDAGSYVLVSTGGHPEFGDVGDLLEKAEQAFGIADVFRTDFIKPETNVLLVNTEPPWPIPPPPPPKQ